MVKRKYAARNRKTQAKARAQTGITAGSEPERIISVLSFRSEEDTNQWGDDLGDLRIALRTLENLAYPPKPQWSALIIGGLAEALCLGFLEYTREMLLYKSPRPARPRPGTPEFEERLDFLFDENPPFYFPLCILYEGLGSIPPYGQAVGYDPTTNRVLDAIRERWLAMTDRVWDEDLKMEKSPSRAMMSSLTQKLLRIDPSFISTMYVPMGLTLPLLAQGWRFAQVKVEQFIHIQALFTFMECLRTMPFYNVLGGSPGSIIPTNNPLDDLYYHGREDHATGIISQIFEGFDSMTSAPDIGKLFEQLFDPDLSPEEGSAIFSCISCLIGTPYSTPYKIQRKDFHDLARTVYLTGRFWHERFGSFLGMTRMMQGLPYLEKNKRILIAFMSTFASSRSVIDVYGKCDEARTLVQGWVESGLFEVLELVAVALLSNETEDMPIEMTGTLDFIFSALSLAVNEDVDWALPLLAPYLPRPCLLRALIDWHLNQLKIPQRVPGETIMLGVCTDQLTDSHVMHRTWLMIMMLSGQRYADGMCGRRDCNEKGEMRCAACSLVKYCGADCQRADWKEHRQVCGMRAIVGHKEFGLSDLYKDADDQLSFLDTTSEGCGSIRLIYPGKAASRSSSTVQGRSGSGEVEPKGAVEEASQSTY